MQPTTNAGDTTIASALVELTKLDQGTLLVAEIHKMGDARGPADGRVIYGDDLVRVIIWTGFSYRALIERSDKMLRRQLAQGGYIERLARLTLEEHAETTIEDVCHALQETQDWLRRVLAGDNNGAGPSPSVMGVPWEPLQIDGALVRGSRVYNGPDRSPLDDRAPVPGTIYVQGVKLGQKVLVPARNGAWRADSKPKSLAKRIIKEALPVGLYCQYRLEPERVNSVAVGEAACRESRAWGIGINSEALRSLFKIAA